MLAIELVDEFGDDDADDDVELDDGELLFVCLFFSSNDKR